MGVFPAMRDERNFREVKKNVGILGMCFECLLEGASGFIKIPEFHIAGSLDIERRRVVRVDFVNFVNFRKGFEDSLLIEEGLSFEKLGVILLALLSGEIVEIDLVLVDLFLWSGSLLLRLGFLSREQTGRKKKQGKQCFHKLLLEEG